MSFCIFGTSKCAFNIKAFNYFGQFFQYLPKHGNQHICLSNIFKNTQNGHNTDWCCVVYGQATDKLSEEYGLKSKNNGLVSL